MCANVQWHKQTNKCAVHKHTHTFHFPKIIMALAVSLAVTCLKAMQSLKQTKVEDANLWRAVFLVLVIIIQLTSEQS